MERNRDRIALKKDNNAIQFRDCDREILLSRDKYGELVELLKSRYAGLQI